jgi:hypothetical protein
MGRNERIRTPGSHKLVLTSGSQPLALCRNSAERISTYTCTSSHAHKPPSRPCHKDAETQHRHTARGLRESE